MPGEFDTLALSRRASQWRIEAARVPAGSPVQWVRFVYVRRVSANNVSEDPLIRRSLAILARAHSGTVPGRKETTMRQMVELVQCSRRARTSSDRGEESASSARQLLFRSLFIAAQQEKAVPPHYR
jgi:hypothetical protein